MVYDLSHEIIYYPRNFGIFDVESMRVLEGVYVHKFMHYAKIDDIEKAFLIKLGRKPNKAEIDYQNKLKSGLKAPLGAYDFNWSIYCSQNILIEYPNLIPSSDEVVSISESTLGHKITERLMNIIGRLVRSKLYRLKDGYYGVNAWQYMGVVSSLNSLNIIKNEKSISLLFNKIYKRNPTDKEILVCKNLELTSIQEVQDAIEQHIKLYEKKSVSSKRRTRRTRSESK